MDDRLAQFIHRDLTAYHGTAPHPAAAGALAALLGSPGGSQSPSAAIPHWLGTSGGTSHLFLQHDSTDDSPAEVPARMGQMPGGEKVAGTLRVPSARPVSDPPPASHDAARSAAPAWSFHAQSAGALADAPERQGMIRYSATAAASAQGAGDERGLTTRLEEGPASRAGDESAPVPARTFAAGAGSRSPAFAALGSLLGAGGMPGLGSIRKLPGLSEAGATAGLLSPAGSLAGRLSGGLDGPLSAACAAMSSPVTSAAKSVLSLLPMAGIHAGGSDASAGRPGEGGGEPAGYDRQRESSGGEKSDSGGAGNSRGESPLPSSPISPSDDNSLAATLVAAIGQQVQALMPGGDTQSLRRGLDQAAMSMRGAMGG